MDEIAQAPTFPPSPLLQLRIAEASFLALLRGDHIGLLERIAGATGQLQKGLQLKRFGQPRCQLWCLTGMGQEGIKLLEGQRFNFGWKLV